MILAVLSVRLSQSRGISMGQARESRGLKLLWTWSSWTKWNWDHAFKFPSLEGCQEISTNPMRYKFAAKNMPKVRVFLLSWSKSKSPLPMGCQWALLICDCSASFLQRGPAWGPVFARTKSQKMCIYCELAGCGIFKLLTLKLPVLVYSESHTNLPVKYITRTNGSKSSSSRFSGLLHRTWVD